MKYVRAKDGIYDLDKSIWYEFTGRKVRMPYCEEYEKQPGLCKTVETIEELCDEFVLFRDNKPYAIVPNKEHNAELAHDVWKDYRGAIWTDKGLIFVAKMNNKGVLELL